MIDKLVGQQFSDASNSKFCELQPYNDLNATIGYSSALFELDVSANNLLGSRETILITPGGTGTSAATSTDRYFFQPPTSVVATLKGSLLKLGPGKPPAPNPVFIQPVIIHTKFLL